ncbi:neural-cadherin [Caerostris darwini]|uniref:Neural-cadherin n=1 Tax=Caerostris darwini TaxID=1538125 RepID=A0AAV4PT48_9ARAC|nr:neural-cadherin [Caerostris darwini]
MEHILSSFNARYLLSQIDIIARNGAEKFFLFFTVQLFYNYSPKPRTRFFRAVLTRYRHWLPGFGCYSDLIFFGIVGSLPWRRNLMKNNGIQQLASEATVYIVLEDVNDEIPLFIEREQETVLEGMPPNTKVTQVQASDKDGTYPNNKENVITRSSHQKTVPETSPANFNRDLPSECLPLFIPSTRTSSDRHKFASFGAAPNKSWDYKFETRDLLDVNRI